MPGSRKALAGGVQPSCHHRKFSWFSMPAIGRRQCGFGTGLAASEVAALSLDDIDWQGASSFMARDGCKR